MVRRLKQAEHPPAVSHLKESVLQRTMYQLRYVAFLTATLITVSAPRRAHAEPFSVSGTTVPAGTGQKILNAFYPALSGNPQQAAMAESQINSLIGNVAPQFVASVNGALDQLNFTNMLGALANAGALSSKAMPGDYATDMTLFSLSVAGVAATNGFSPSSLQSFENNLAFSANQAVPALGLSAGASATLSLNLALIPIPNLGPIDFSKMILSVSYFQLDLPSNLIEDVSGAYRTFGLHGQYRLIDSISIAPGGILHWGGVSIGTGFNYGTLSLQLPVSLPSQTLASEGFTFQNKTLDTNFDWSGKALFSASIGNVTIPFEAFTSIQLLYFLTLFGGGALDLNFGSATFAATAKAPVNVTMRDPQNGSSGSIMVDQLDAVLNYQQSGRPAWANLRGFIGAQINMGVLALFGQISGDTAGSSGANLGARIYW